MLRYRRINCLAVLNVLIFSILESAGFSAGAVVPSKSVHSNSIVETVPASKNGGQLLGTSSTEKSPSKFTRFLEFNDNMTVSWEVDLDKKMVTFKVVAKTLGWVGFGLSKTGLMPNSDLVIGGAGPNGTFYFSDRIYREGHAPIVDKAQNWFLISASEGHGQTELKFWRFLDTQDATEDIIISDSDIHFIWATGQTDEISYHGDNRGSAIVNILTPPPSKFTRFLQLHKNFSVSWEVNNVDQTVTFEVVANTIGWVGFGLSTCGSMKNADVVFGGVGANNTFYFADRHVGDEHTSAPTIDKEQNWYLISSSESVRRGQTQLKFWRHFNTGDADEDLPILNEETHFVWAMGDSDDIHQEIGTGKDKRGSAHVNVLEPPPEKFSRSMELNDKFSVEWHVDNLAETVTFEILAKTTGWVGFGLSGCGDMKNADLVIGGVGPDNTFYFADRFVAERHSNPTIDQQQDWFLLSASEDQVKGETRLKFWRRFDTQDKKDDLVILNKETHFLWAIGQTDDISQHRPSDRGSDHVNILDPTPVPETTVTVTTDSNTIQTDDGTVTIEVETSSEVGSDGTLRDFTVEQLFTYNGLDADKPAYLAVKKNVFDVSSAPHIYRPGGMYSFLTGRDASRFLATHTNPVEGVLIQFDDLSDLNDAQRKSLDDWERYYTGKYPIVGQLVAS